MMKVSIIIPSTGKRFDLLQRAIKSCILQSSNIEVEVIIVINGNDRCKFDLKSTIKSECIHYFFLEQGNVSLARNYGLMKATGDLIRFLDDDDYLYTEISYAQYMEFYLNNNLSISMYGVDIVDKYCNLIENQKQVSEKDFIEYSFDPDLALPLCFVYRLSLLKDIQWDEDVKIPEDEDFLRRIAIIKDINFKISNKKVGAWYQHEGERLSIALLDNQYYVNKFDSINKLYKKLNNINYDSIAANSMWNCIHGGFYLSPIFWTKMALYARKLDPKSKPQDIFFHKIPSFVHPLFIEWFMLPKRWLCHKLRVLRQKMGLTSYIRKL